MIQWTIKNKIHSAGYVPNETNQLKWTKTKSLICLYSSFDNHNPLTFSPIKVRNTIACFECKSHSTFILAKVKRINWARFHNAWFMCETALSLWHRQPSRKKRNCNKWNATQAKKEKATVHLLGLTKSNVSGAHGKASIQCCCVFAHGFILLSL